MWTKSGSVAKDCGAKAEGTCQLSSRDAWLSVEKHETRLAQESESSLASALIVASGSRMSSGWQVSVLQKELTTQALEWRSFEQCVL